MSSSWYAISNIDTIDSPATVIYKDRVTHNIKTLVQSIDDVSRLRPHIKTHKSSEVSAMMLANGIRKFKCATVAEAEMLANAGARDILLAYQPVGPKASRFIELCRRFTDVSFACLIDDDPTARHLDSLVRSNEKPIRLFIDLNVGMNRTGVAAAAAFTLWDRLQSFERIQFAGLHAYDGHLRDADYTTRKQKCDEVFAVVEALATQIESTSGKKPAIVAGGTPTYSIHSKRKEIECSPGTFIYWDKGYEQILQEQRYLHAAVVVTRVISKPAPDLICIDLGHKSIASENPLHHRVHFLNATDAEPVGHSEEHMVLKIKESSAWTVGDVLYGVPFHVCPTIALYERCFAAENGAVVEEWTTLARNKKITI
jgi:D-threonine aldolase